MSDPSYYGPGETEFRRWASGEPNNRPDEQYTMLYSDGRWHDYDCNGRTWAVCFDVTGLSAVSSHAERQYHFVSEAKTMSEAQRYCREKHTDLATVDSMEVVKLLNNMAGQYNQSAWIGLYDDRDTWRWSMSDPSFYGPGETEFRRWASGEPSNRPDEQCTCFYSDGRWYDRECDYPTWAVCCDVTGLPCCIMGTVVSHRVNTTGALSSVRSPVTMVLPQRPRPAPTNQEAQPFQPSQIGPLHRHRKVLGSIDKQKRKEKHLRIGAWNVRTLTDNQASDRPERRTTIISRELGKFQIGIAALSKTRLADEGQLKEEKGGYAFFWKGKPANEPRIHGVGFWAIENCLINHLHELPVGINEHLMTIRLMLASSQMVTVISAYAPTLDAQDEVKEAFYADLYKILSEVPKEDKLILLGDFNARVGRNHHLWRGTLGRDGVGNRNSNGILLLTKCSEHNLVITNTLFHKKTNFKTSWMHPRSKLWHLIDYVIVRSKDRRDVLNTRAMTSGDDCWTDHHRLIRSIIIGLYAHLKTHKDQEGGQSYSTTSDRQ
ncbi:hypothetical protein JOQ06_007432 [Pogonophryne albipinna]|uniref:C-type lectin domain-containing protein n=1 Tax=Pogonophryne albipinna TaxID=1090488 RepID=A0AAD6B0V0_9TELE|nr:hypothetical protein JOQ06_007432 [Pogonophryne albipinna]